MIKRSLRRASTHPDQVAVAGSDPTSAWRTSTAPQETSRRPSLASISRKLGRSKKSQVRTTTTVINDGNKLGDLFTALPHDIHSLIFSLLPTADILALRLTSSTVNSLLNSCASTIAYSVLSTTLALHDFQHVMRLYPLPRRNYDLNHLLTLLRHHHTILATTNMLNNFIQHKIYMLRPHRGQNTDSARIQERLSNIATTALWHISHLLEHHRALLLNEHPNNHTETENPSSRRSRFWPCQSCTSSLARTIASYPQHILLPTYHIHHILTLHLRQSSRAPSYTGTIERALRGWSRKPPGDEQLAMVVLLGGLEELRKITVLKGTYNNRLETLKTFLMKVEDAVEERKARDIAEASALTRPRTGKMVVGPRGIERVEVAGSISTTDSAATQESSSAPSITAAAAAAAATTTTTTPASIQRATRETTTTTDITTSHRPQFHSLTEDTLTQIPPLEDIFLLPLRRRIESELVYPDPNNPEPERAVGLLDFLPEEDRDEEFETPYRWVGRVVSGEDDLMTYSFPAAPRLNGDEDEDGAGDHDGPAAMVAADDGHIAASIAHGLQGGNGAAAPAAVGSGGGGAGVGVGTLPQQQQQPQPPPGLNQRGRLASSGAFTFGEFRRSILVPVGRGD